MDRPVVSVVIPTYNRLPLLREAVASVEQQTFEDWELLIVDDGSEDRTAEACAALENPRISVVALQHSGLVGHVRNEGARRAKGHYLAFLDSDDLWRPTKLDRQLGALKVTETVWSYTGFDLIDTSGACLNTFPLAGETGASAELLFDLLTTKTAAAMSSLAITREVFWRTGGFSAHPRIREDHDLVIRLAEARQPRVEVPEILLAMRQHGRRSEFGERDPFLRSAIAYEHFLERGARPDAETCARRVLARHLIASARVDLRHGQRTAAAEKLRRAANPGWRKPSWWLTWLRFLTLSG